MLMGANPAGPELEVFFATACRRLVTNEAWPVTLASTIKAMKREMFGQKIEEALRSALGGHQAVALGQPEVTGGRSQTHCARVTSHSFATG